MQFLPECGWMFYCVPTALCCCRQGSYTLSICRLGTSCGCGWVLLSESCVKVQAPGRSGEVLKYWFTSNLYRIWQPCKFITAAISIRIMIFVVVSLMLVSCTAYTLGPSRVFSCSKFVHRSLLKGAFVVLSFYSLWKILKAWRRLLLMHWTRLISEVSLEGDGAELETVSTILHLEYRCAFWFYHACWFFLVWFFDKIFLLYRSFL